MAVNPAWRVRRRRRVRQLVGSFVTGAAIGALVNIVTALVGDMAWASLAVRAIGGIGLVFGLALVVGLNLGRPLSIKGETPSEAMPPRPFTGLCVVVFAVAVIVVGAITGGLLFR